MPPLPSEVESVIRAEIAEALDEHSPMHAAAGGEVCSCGEQYRWPSEHHPHVASVVFTIVTDYLADRDREGRERAAADVEWLADARQEYDHRDPAKAFTDAEREAYLAGEHHGARQVARILAGDENAAKSWLPSWHWTEWAGRGGEA